MSARYYILDAEGNPTPEPDALKWAQWFEQNPDREVVVEDRIGDVKVWTVFLGIDQSFSEGPPVLWQTMVFGGIHDRWQDRYCSREDAVFGHRKALEMIEMDAWLKRADRGLHQGST